MQTLILDTLFLFRKKKLSLWINDLKDNNYYAVKQNFTKSPKHDMQSSLHLLTAELIQKHS